MNILLVEPDKVLSLAATERLKAEGYHITHCRSAQGAINALDKQQMDLIILELQLGIHNGIEFLYEMHSYPEWQHIPVIIHTINSNATDERFKESLLQLGVREILYKPTTNLKQLVRAIGQFVPL